MELAVFTTRIDAGWQVAEEVFVKDPAGKRSIELAWIDAGQPGPQSGLDHVARQLGCRLRLPEREERLKAGARQTSLAVAAHVLEKEIAEGDMREAVGDEPFDRRFHDRFILLVRTRPRQRQHMERQSSGGGLGFEQFPPDCVHRHAIERLVRRGEEPGGSTGILLVEHMEHPRRVLAGRPTDKNLAHLLACWPAGLMACHGCSAFAIFSMPSTTRGPGTVRPGPLRITTRRLRTAGTAERVIHGSTTVLRSASLRR